MNAKAVFPDVAPWPEMPAQDRNPRVAIGDNRPPLEEQIPAEFREALKIRPDYDQAEIALKGAEANDR